MRSLLSLLMTVAALSLAPTELLGEDHSHCEESVATQATLPEAVAPATAELVPASGPCGECPDTNCSTHRSCAAGTAPAAAEAILSDATVPGGAATGLQSSSVFRPTFDPTPPTPPPNVRTR